MLKYLDPLKNLGIDEKTTSNLITIAYNYYQTKEIDKKAITKKEHAKLVSCFVRFFHSINLSKPIEEDLLQLYYKDKPNIIKLLVGYIKEIWQIQKQNQNC